MPEGMGGKLFGDWEKAAEIVHSMEEKWQRAAEKAMAQEAHFMRSKIVVGLREQAPGGQAFTPLAPTTLAQRAFMGFKGEKALIRRGDLRNNIVIKKLEHEKAIFVGILRTAKSKAGGSLVNLAKLHEDGGGPFLVPITQKSRRFYHAMLSKAGIQGPAGTGTEHGSGVTVAIIKIPARPFFRPVFEKYGEPKQVRERFYASIVKQLAGDFSPGG